MRRKEGMFILDEVNSEDMKEKFQGFEGIIIYANSPTALAIREGYYKEDNYKLTEILQLILSYKILNTDNVTRIKKCIDVIRNKMVFEDRIPEIAITEMAARIIGVI